MSSLAESPHTASSREWSIAAFIVLAVAVAVYLPSLTYYFIRDDFGVVQLLAGKPAGYFPRWFVTSWMDEIWGYLPDEIRPFPAVSYQLTAFGGPSSPIAHHAFNIVLHAMNASLVLALARRVAGLSIAGALCAGLVFALLPVNAESVAWITGRVDSMPALFYVGSFLAYVRWRQNDGRASLYVLSLMLFFVALFTKQNTITMVATLMAYDLIVRRTALWPPWRLLGAYAPFVMLTAGYLGLRYRLFGEIAREGQLNETGLRIFADLMDRHLRHVLTGIAEGPRPVVWSLLAGAALMWLVLRRIDGVRARVLLFFGPVWWGIGVLPIIVAGYESPRHVYLAAMGWAVIIGIAVNALWNIRSGVLWRRTAAGVAAIPVAAYAILCVLAVRQWGTIATVSKRAVVDVGREATVVPAGSLVILGVPTLSWEWALPFSLREPFASADLTKRAFVISPRALHCCRSQWFDYTRRTLAAWADGSARNSVVGIHWALRDAPPSRLTQAEDPALPSIARALRAVEDPEALDAALRRLVASIERPSR